MARNKGIGFWTKIADKFEGKIMSDDDYSYCDSLRSKMKTDKDQSILELLDILIENDEQRESYFRNDLLSYAEEVYKGE